MLYQQVPRRTNRRGNVDGIGRRRTEILGFKAISCSEIGKTHLRLATKLWEQNGLNPVVTIEL